MLITLARKPLTGSVVQNVLAHGTGALNVDACKIGTERVEAGRARRSECSSKAFGKNLNNGGAGVSMGRWPANLLVTSAAAETMDAQTGILHPRGNLNPTKGSTSGMFWGEGKASVGGFFVRDTGGASRYFKRVQRQPDGLPSQDKQVGEPQC